MRRLVWLAIGLCAGCALCAYVSENKILLAVAVIALIVSVLLICFKKMKMALIGIGLTCGILYTACYNYFYLQAVKEYDGAEQTVTITATDYSRQTDYGISCEGTITFFGKTYNILFYDYEQITINPGDQITGRFLLRLTAPKGSKESTYQQGKGISFIGYARGEIAITSGNREDIRYFPQHLRKTILSHLEAIFPEDTAGFSKALLLGDTNSLTYAQDVAFQTSGIRHIVAVSGLHVSILFALIYTLSGKKRYATALFGIPTLILFACVAGFSPSILRACIMQIVMILALLLRREYDPPSALALAVLVILLMNPFAVVSVSFQLSCGCIVGIFLFSGRLRNYFYTKVKGFTFKAKALRAVGSGISVTVGTMITTIPLCAIYFEGISLVGVLTNLLTLWAVSFIFYGIVAACTVSFLCLPVAQIVASVISVLMRYVLKVAELLSRFPLAAVYTASPYIVLCLVLCYGIFILFWLCGRKYLKTTVASMAFLLVIAIAFSWIEPRLDNYRITVLDVGQGQSVLLQSRGETYLVDCGGSSHKNAANTAATQLLSQGITHIDGVILTHYDGDHIGGISYFLQRIEADIIYLPYGKEPSADLALDYKTAILSNIREIRLGIGKLTLIPGYDTENSNENSTCVLFQAGGCAILITGDRAEEGEAKLLQQTDLPKLDYLVAGHHGAQNSTSTALLEQTMPETVIISAGKNNPYGHPQEMTLFRLQTFGCRILRTDQNGTIIIRG